MIIKSSTEANMRQDETEMAIWDPEKIFKPHVPPVVDETIRAFEKTSQWRKYGSSKQEPGHKYRGRFNDRKANFNDENKAGKHEDLGSFKHRGMIN